jgi:hypothetical protein
MTRAEWLSSENAPAMLKALWDTAGGDEAALVPVLQRYLLACCRRIWRLLPQESSRRGVEVAELFLAGAATAEELKKANWHCEGAAFNIDYNCDPSAIQHWVAMVRDIPPSEMASVLNPPGAAVEVDERTLLKRAAYFAHHAMTLPQLTPKHPVPASYAMFLSASLLREHFGTNSIQGRSGI